MKRRLYLMGAAATAFVMSACSSSGYQDRNDPYATSGPIGGQYQANAYQLNSSSIGPSYGMASGCETFTMPAPPSPCARNPITSTYGASSIAPSYGVPSPAYNIPAYTSLRSAYPAPQVAYGLQMPSYQIGAPVRSYGAHSAYGLRPSYIRPKRSYVYGEIGAVNHDALEAAGGIQGRIGYQSAHYLGAEIEGSIGLESQKSQGQDPSLIKHSERLGVEHSVAGFAVVRQPISNSLNVFGRVGYHETKEDTVFYTDCTMLLACPPGVEGTKTSKGLAFGPGVEWVMSPNNVLRADVTAYDTANTRGKDYWFALSLGYQRQF